MAQHKSIQFLIFLIILTVHRINGRDTPGVEGVPLSRRSRAAVPSGALIWPDGVIPYILDDQFFNKEEKQDLMESIKTWNEETCLLFRPYQSQDNHWLRITDGTSCYSQFIGFGKIGEQVINFSKNGCRYYGLYTHEFGHVVGLDHEHIRNDRDHFVSVDVEGVPAEYTQFYEKKGIKDLRTYDTPYDLQSIMHYGPGSFSIHFNKSPLTVRDPSVRHVLREIYTKDLSFWDAKAVNLHYKCEKKCKGPVPICERPGFVDKNCKCQTPLIFAQRRCIDSHGTGNCESLANRLECYRNASFMAINCRKTCQFCYKESLSQIPKQEKPRCADHHESCSAWAKDNHCNKNANYMDLMCPKSCNKCNVGDKAMKSGTSAEDNDDCRDTYRFPSDCKLWAERNECKTSYLWMLHNCAASCGKCVSKKTTTASPAPMTTVAPVECIDRYGSSNCRSWQSRGLCKHQRSWMIRNCEKSCGYCNSSTAQKPTITTLAPVHQPKQQQQSMTGINSTNSNAQVESRFLATANNTIVAAPLIARPLPSIGVCFKGDPAIYCPLHYRSCKSISIFRMCPNICGNCGKCEDRTWNCDNLKKHGYCKEHPLSTLPYCRKTCGTCDP